MCVREWERERERLKPKTPWLLPPFWFHDFRWFPPLDDVFPIWLGPHLVSSTSTTLWGGGEEFGWNIIVWLWCKVVTYMCWQTNPSFLPFFLASFHPIGEEKIGWNLCFFFFSNWWRRIGWILSFFFFSIGEEEWDEI